jgi:hypothetical protein
VLPVLQARSANKFPSRRAHNLKKSLKTQKCRENQKESYYEREQKF